MLQFKSAPKHIRAIGGGAGGGAEGAEARTYRQGGKRYEMPPISQT